MEEFKAKDGEWLYMPALGQVVCVGKGVIAELIVTGDEDENGRKMAAAPELLEALQEMVSIVKKNSYPQPDKPSSNYARAEAAQAVIAKALGK